MENEAFDKGADKSESVKSDAEFKKSSSMNEKELSLELPIDNQPADKPYSGMGKEDLLKFSDTPFWNTLRLTFLIIFWLGWVALLGAVIGLTIVAPRCDPAPTQQWWQKTTFYQIYVRSFYDSDGDGIGDLKGVTEKLDYLQDLNVEAIMLSSFYESSGQDYGYEVTDHTSIQTDYGNLDDFQELLREAHNKGLKVIIDFIPNHTGDQHPWFIDWSNGVGNDDFYVSAESALGPDNINNWKSVYGDSAWQPTGQGDTHYLHQLLETQPELNLRNSVVMDELENILRYWLEMGVDGFRIVGAKYLVEDFTLRDDTFISGCPDPDAYECYEHDMTSSQPENVDKISQWRAIINSYSNEENITILLSDAKESIENDVMYYGLGEADASQLPIHYQLLEAIGNLSCGGFCLHDVVNSWLEMKPDFATLDWLTGQQDETRLTSSRGRNFSIAMSVLRMTLPGSPLVYYGEELGMVDGDSSSFECGDPGYNGTLKCREVARTPMQWENSPNGGFTNNSDSWLPVNDDFSTVNVQDLDNDDEYSPLVVFKKLAELRQTSTALQYGDIHMSVVNEDVFSFIREFDGTDRYLVSVNFGTKVTEVEFAGSHDLVPGSAEVVIFNRPGYSAGDEINLNDPISMMPGDALVLMWSYSRP